MKNPLVLLILSVLLVQSAYAFTGPTAAPPTNAGQSLFSSGGNVGIGTTDPSAGKTVISNSSGNTLVLQKTGGAAALAFGSSTVPNLLFESVSGGGFQIYTGTGTWGSPTWTSRMYMDSSGKVGIATSTPSEKLQVYGGNVKADSFIGTISGDISAANVKGPSVFGANYGTYTYSFPSSLGVATSSASGLPQPLSVYGNAYVSGNVGIGITNPTSKLEINGGLYVNGNLTVSGTRILYFDANGLSLPNTSYSHIRFGQSGFRSHQISSDLFLSTNSYYSTVPDWKYINSAYATLFTVNDGYGNFAWDTAPTGIAGAAITWTPRMVLTNAGNVGIGTTGPGATLDVSGQIRSNSYLQFDKDNNTNNVGMYWNAYANGTATYNYINTGAWGGTAGRLVGSGNTLSYDQASGGINPITWTNRLTINSSGNVGINDTTPTEGTLTVGGTGYFSSDLTLGTYLWFNQPGSGTYNRTQFIPNSTNQFFIETARQTDAFNATPLSFIVGWRGGQKGLEVTNSGITVYQHTGGGAASANGAITAGAGTFSGTVTVATPTAAGHATTKSYVDSAVTGGTGIAAACTGDATCEMNAANLQGGNITGVNKLTVTTIDPLYQIGTSKYSTYAASVVGGVKEEYVGRGVLTYSSYKTHKSYLSYEIDFSKVEADSNLWLWRKVVDFSPANIEIFATPIGQPVPIAYEIDGEKIIFRAEKSDKTDRSDVEFSYRLIGNRFDWRDWPTYAKNQSERSSLIIK